MEPNHVVAQPLPPHRWLVTSNGKRLHRVSEIDTAALADDCTALGRTICGYSGCLEIPGVADRLSGPRCDRCCDAVGIPRGNGAPFNVFTDERRNR